MSPITCHVLDSSTGKPAVGVHVVLQRFPTAPNEGGHYTIANGETNSDGRCNDLWPPHTRDIQEGDIYKLIFYPKEYFTNSGRECFYPWVDITFRIQNPHEHYHIPLLISPFGFTTYRGS